jgi:hypothetical protein
MGQAAENEWMAAEQLEQRNETDVNGDNIAHQ